MFFEEFFSLHSMKILVVKTSALGDVVQAFPVASYIKQLYPHSQLEWVAERAAVELIAAHPSVDRVYGIDTKRWRKNVFSKQTWLEASAVLKQLRASVYDVIFDLQGNSKSALLLLPLRAFHKVGFSKKAVAEWPNILATNQRFTPPQEGNIRDENLFLVKSFFEMQGEYAIPSVTLRLTAPQREKYREIALQIATLPRKKLLVCPGAAWPNKQMEERQLASFLKKIAATEAFSFAFIWGNEAEKIVAMRLAEQLRLYAQAVILDRLELPLLQNVMELFSCIIAMDSLPLHLAASTGKATFSVFGPSLALKYAPKGAHQLAIQGTCPYGERFHRRCSFLRSCPTGACLRSIPPDDLAEAFCRAYC